MSDEEEVMSGEEESEEEESREATPEPEEDTEAAAPEDSGPSEAELAMQKRRQKQSSNYGNLDEEAQELLEANKEERELMEQEIRDLQERREQRKKEREEEERTMAERRAEEETRRKKEEEDRQAKKVAEEQEKRAAREEKMAEFEKFKNTSGTPNFVITKKDVVPGKPETGGDGEECEKKSKEQLEAEKKAILAQRVPKLEIDGADSGKLTDKAKELHALIVRLESEKYDLEKRFKTQQYDMMELAERARQMNKVGRGGLKRVQLAQDDVDVMSERFAGCPSKVVMYSPFERQMDGRQWGVKREVFTGDMYKFPAAKITQKRLVKFDENTNLPIYEWLPGMEPADDEEE